MLPSLWVASAKPEAGEYCWEEHYPCLCLCRGLVQMTMVLPCRLITRHRSHMGLTDGLTFISAIPIRDPAAREVVRRQLHLHLVAGKDPDVVLPHLPRDRRENVVPTFHLDTEHGAWQGLRDLAFDLDLVLLLGQIPFVSNALKMRTNQPASCGRVMVANWV